MAEPANECRIPGEVLFSWDTDAPEQWEVSYYDRPGNPKYFCRVASSGSKYKRLVAALFVYPSPPYGFNRQAHQEIRKAFFNQYANIGKEPAGWSRWETTIKRSIVFPARGLRIKKEYHKLQMFNDRTFRPGNQSKTRTQYLALAFISDRRPNGGGRYVLVVTPWASLRTNPKNTWVWFDKFVETFQRDVPN